MTEPLTTSAIALKVAPSVAGALVHHAGTALSPSEETRFKRALSKAITESIGEKPGWNHPLKRIGRRRRVRKVRNELEELHPGRLLARRGEGKGAPMQHLPNWRDDLVEQLRITAEEGLASDRGTWSPVERTGGPGKWAERAAARFELELAKDKQLRTLVARLDWGDEHASRVVLAAAVDDMKTALWQIAASLAIVAGALTYVADEVF